MQRRRLATISFFLVCTQVEAQPGLTFEQQLEQLIDGASHAWLEEQTQAGGTESEAMDEALFTDISPLIESSEPVKLPEDQQPAQ